VLWGKELKDSVKILKMNITNNEEKALRELLDDDYIVIRLNDKSSGVVVTTSAIFSVA
jgi:hypothetical protein